MSGIYRYGMRLRGFSIGAQPMDGFEEREDDPTGKYHDILAYKRKLTVQEEAEYELDYLGEPDKDHLLPCPFCGGKATVEKIDNEENLGKPGWDTYWIRFEDCDAETTACASEEEAAYRWNMRAGEVKA